VDPHRSAPDYTIDLVSAPYQGSAPAPEQARTNRFSGSRLSFAGVVLDILLGFWLLFSIGSSLLVFFILGSLRAGFVFCSGPDYSYAYCCSECDDVLF